MAKRRVIALKFAGKNLTAPPAGYTSRTEACVKRWLSRLPSPADAQPDDVVTIQDVADCEDDLASLDAMRRSFTQDEKPGEIAADKSHDDAPRSHSQDGEVPLEGDPARKRNISYIASDDVDREPPESNPSALEDSSVETFAAAQQQEEGASADACIGSCVNTEQRQAGNVKIVQGGVAASQTPVQMQSENATCCEERPGSISYAEAPVVDCSAVEIGMERYLGMAEAVKEDRVSVLQEALRLAVSDRISARILTSTCRAHLAHAAKLTHDCERAQFQLAERQAAINAHLQSIEELREHKRMHEWEQRKAKEDVFCAQQQLEASGQALRDAVATMEQRIADLTARNQEVGEEKLRLEEKLAGAMHQVTKLRSSTGVLQQQLDSKMVECKALNAELKDNLQRWEQESMQRMLAEEDLENKKSELKLALDEGRKAVAAAGMKEKEHKVAVRELASCKRRHCSLLSAKAALQHGASGGKVDSSPSKKAQYGCPASGSTPALKQPLSDKSSLKHTETHSVDQNPVGKNGDKSEEDKHSGTFSESGDQKLSEGDSEALLPLRLKTDKESLHADVSSTQVTVALHKKPDTKAVWLQGQVLRQAFSTAPPALKMWKMVNDSSGMQALNIAVRCIILAQPGSETLAAQMSERMSIHYRTLPCLVTEGNGTDSRFACVDVHTIHTLLPICHKALLIELQPKLASAVQKLARDHGIPTATFTSSEELRSECTEELLSNQNDSALHTDDAANSDVDRSVVSVKFSSPTSSDGMQHANIGFVSALEKVQSWIGVPDTVLQCFSPISLKSLCKGHGTAHYKLQPGQHALLDLANFTAQGGTQFYLQDLNVVSCKDGEESAACKSEILELDEVKMLHSTAVHNATQLALYLIMNCQSVQHLDLSDVNITVDTARLLAQAIVQSSCSRLETVVLCKAALPAGILLGRPSPMTTQQPQYRLMQYYDRTAAILCELVTDKDLAFMTILLESAPDTSLTNLELKGTLNASKAQLERFACAVAQLHFLGSFQGISCDCFHDLTGKICPYTVEMNSSNKAEHVMGTLGALVFACFLQQSLAPAANCGPDGHECANMFDGPVQDAPSDGKQQDSCPLIHTVDLGGTQIGELGSERMAQVLGQAQFSSVVQLHLPCTLPGLQEMNLSDNSIVCKGVQAFVHEVMQSVPMRSLNLSNNSLTDEAGAAVAGLLLPSSTCSLSHLLLSGNCSVGSSTAAKLAQALPYTTALRSLELARTQLTRQALPQLARALRENQSLISLDISNSKIGVQEVASLSRVLDCNTSLRSLRMSKNSIGDQGAAAIGTLLMNASLTYINVSHCCIRVSGAKWLAEALPRAQSLQHLDISSNSIGDIGAASLVQSSACLTKLELGCTDVSSAGLASVASHLSANCANVQLRSLNLSRNPFGDKSMDQLCAAISSNTQLQSINLSGCGLGNTGLRRLLNLVQAIKHSKAVSHRRHLLQEVTVSHNSRVDNILLRNFQELLISLQDKGVLQQ